LIISEMFEKCGTALDELPEGVLPGDESEPSNV
jgi:hypothetical protein